MIPKSVAKVVFLSLVFLLKHLFSLLTRSTLVIRKSKSVKPSPNTFTHTWSECFGYFPPSCDGASIIYASAEKVHLHVYLLTLQPIVVTQSFPNMSFYLSFKACSIICYYFFVLSIPQSPHIILQTP